MKICWDNLEGFRLTKNGNLHDGRTTYYEKVCKNCGEDFLGQKVANFCTKSCLTRSKKTRLKIGKASLGRAHTEEAKKKIGEAKSGEKHWNWQGGLSYEEYCPIFSDKEFKQMIRDRDGNVCLNCGKTEEQNGQKLTGHHIDYDKKECPPKNIITLCMSCNVSANFDREWYTAYYQTILHRRYGYKYE